MKSVGRMTGCELAAFVQTHLKQKGIDVVLSGGTCVSFYSDNRYVSMDLDLINIYFTRRSDIRKAMNEIGFSEKGRHFEHPDSEFLVEFPAGPLSVGEEPVAKIEEFDLVTGTLKIISATDCVKDRLAAYYHWKDLQCLEQACLVAAHSEIDLREVERWSGKEGKMEEFEHFREKLAS